MENKSNIDIYKKISKAESIFTPEQYSVIHKQVAKGTSFEELTLFGMTCKSVGLNPLIGEIWCYKDNKNNLIIFAGRDGFLKKAQESNRWNGIASSEIREKDEFSLDIPNAKINHLIKLGDRGKIIAAYAICRPKGCDIATIELVDFDVYNKGQFTWKSHPADMIKKVAEIKALKKAYGISGIQCEEDFHISNNKAYAIDTEEKITNSKIAFVENLINNSTFDDELKESYMTELQSSELTNSKLDEIISELTNVQKNPIESGDNYNMSDINKQLDKVMANDKK